MIRAAGAGAGIATIVTLLIGWLALAGAELPVLGYVLYPGSFLAWAYKGDNYTSGGEFLRYSILFAVLVNGVVGAVVGVAVQRLFGPQSANRR